MATSVNNTVLNNRTRSIDIRYAEATR